MNLLVCIFQLLLLLYEFVQVALVLTLPLGPFLFGETTITACSEHRVIILFKRIPVVLLATVRPVRVIQIDVIDNAIAILVKILENIVKIQISSGTAVAIDSIVNLMPVNCVLICI